MNNNNNKPVTFTDEYVRYLQQLSSQNGMNQTSGSGSYPNPSGATPYYQPSQPSYVNSNPSYSYNYVPRNDNNGGYTPTMDPVNSTPQGYSQSYQLPVVPQNSYALPHTHNSNNNTQIPQSTSYNNMNSYSVVAPPVSAPYNIPVQPNVNTDKDSEIARVLQEVERARFEKEREQREAIEKLDKQFAMNLVLDSSRSTAPAPRPDTTRLDEGYAYSLQRQEMVEEEQRKREEEKRRLAALRDEELARRLALEEQRAVQVQKDKELAKELQRQEDAKQNTYYRPNTYSTPSYTPTQVTAKKRRHAVNIHNRWCNCGDTQTYNNNHIFEIHAKHCSCNATYQGKWNEGRVHKHDYRCCSQNHIHTIRCYCVKRNHTCGNGCCSKYHTHLATCHCIAK